jgi:RNA polymerase sigma-70 factor (ECF subfamily)
MSESWAALLGKCRSDLAHADLAVQLERVVALAAETWPRLGIDSESFVRHIAERVPQSSDPRALFATIHWSDLYLACACTLQLPSAIAVLEREHLSRVGVFVARVDSSPDFVDEVRQLMRERLLVGERPRIAEYSGVGTLNTWIRVMAVRLALNAARNNKRRRLRVITPPPMSSVGLRDTRYRAEVEQAFRVALTQLPSTARQILRLHYLERLSQEELARRQGVNRSTVSRRLAAARQALLDRTHRELQQLIPSFSTAGRDSLLRGLHGHIDVSLERALRTSPG